MSHNLSDLDKVVSRLDSETRNRLSQVILANSELQEDTAEEFRKADTNSDNMIDEQEFGMWFLSERRRASEQARADEEDTSLPTQQQMLQLAARNFVPMMGFGFVDNFIMIVAGESIEASIGVTLGLSSFAAAGLGNLTSDVLGLGLSSSIERLAGELGMGSPGLTLKQLDMPECQRVAVLARVLGISIGCLLGMVPLLFM